MAAQIVSVNWSLPLRKSSDADLEPFAIEQRIAPQMQSEFTKIARPRDSWVICGLALGLIEEAVEFAAGRIEGALILFRAVVDQWAAVGPNRE